MKRVTFIIILAVVISIAGVVGYRQKAYAFSCGKSTCGYFTSSGNGSAWYDVLPQPALYNVWNASELINTMSGYLYSGNWQQKMGAAFLIDNMLKYKGKVGDNVGGGVSAGISYAQNSTNFNTWKNMVYFYAAGGSGYGINWNYYPSKQAFCSGRVDSGYDNNGYPNYTGVNDDILYHTPAYGTNACNYEYTNSMPELHFYWPGGEFNIGKHCGNLQDIEKAIPAPNRNPSGSISVTCDKTTWQQVATVSFSDPDAATDGYVVTGGVNVSGTISSGAVVRIPRSDTSPYASQAVTLYIRDSGPVAPPGHYITVSDNTDVPCASLACGFTVTPDKIDPYMGFSIKITVTNNVNQTPEGTVGLQITPPSGATYSYTGSQATASNNSSSVAATFNGLGPTNNTGLFAVKGTFTGGGINISCNGTFPVVYMPYLNVYGGDVLTGASPVYSGGASSCASNASGGIFSWNNVGSGYSGAGTQYAVQALGQIEHFATALKSSSPAPTGLSFANTFNPANAGWLNLGQGLFGGHFGAISDDCDFTSDLTVNPVSGASATTTITNLPATLGKGQTIIYATGNVYISRDITYSTSGWSTPSDVPYFKLVVVGGSIYIASGVKNLDGVYVAEPSGGIGGSIYTCAKGNGTPWNPVTDYASGYYSTCNQKLTINGVFVGKQVNFLRTAGSVGLAAKSADSLATNNDAEVFNYTPEVWLPRGAGSPNGGYTAITGLPPIL